MKQSILRYLPEGGMQGTDAPAQTAQQEQQHPYLMPGADKYIGDVSETYDKKREDNPKWTVEQKVIEDYLSDLPAGTVVVDAPVGSGRFLEYYREKDFTVLGLDASFDQIRVADSKTIQGQKINFGLGDITMIEENGFFKINNVSLDERNQFRVEGEEATLGKKTIDVSLMIRLTRWLTPEGVVKALKTLQRVTRKRIIFTARVRNHVHARSYELIESALEGWQIYKDTPGADLDYRIIELRPVEDCKPKKDDVEEAEVIEAAPAEESKQTPEKTIVVPTVGQAPMKRKQVLIDLIKANNWTRGAEIGVNHGTTIFGLLDACPNLTMLGVDNWDEAYDVYGNGQQYKDQRPIGEEVVRKAKEYDGRAIIMWEDSVKAAGLVERGSLDFIFIDADHSYEAVCKDIDAWRQKLRKGGALMGHDIDWDSVKKAVSEKVGEYIVLPDDVWIAAHNTDAAE